MTIDNSTFTFIKFFLGPEHDAAHTPIDCYQSCLDVAERSAAVEGGGLRDHAQELRSWVIKQSST